MRKQLKSALLYIAICVPINILIQLALNKGYVSTRQVIISIGGTLVSGVFLFSFFRWVNAQQTKKTSKGQSK